MKLWKGRLESEIDARADAFNRSMSFDSKMVREDIEGSIAHVMMLGATGILQQADADKIVQGLEQMLREVEEGTLPLDMLAEDIHTAVEQLLTERIGVQGKMMHTARSRNDQVAIDLRLYLSHQIGLLKAELITVIESLVQVAEENLKTIMPGYTHLQIAQPVTFAHHMMAYAQMFARDLDRLVDTDKRTRVSPLGAGALASTSYPIDRHMTAQLLNFSAPTENSMDSVSDRDFVLELAGTLSILQMHMSRLCEELIIFSSTEYSFISMDDAFSTGSSIMPQKKNPDMAELIRGKTGRVYGNLMSLLTMMKGLPLAYNKDMQEDKEPIFDSCMTVLTALEILAPMLTSMKVNKKRMRDAAAKGYINATDCADYLTKKSMPFRDAYRITGELVRYAVEHHVSLEEIALDIYQNFSPMFDHDIYEAISIENGVAKRIAYGGPAEKAVEVQIANLREKLKEQ